MVRNRVKDIVVSIIVLAISLLFYINTKELTPPADTFPIVVISTFALLGGLLLLKALFYKKYEYPSSKNDEEKDNINPKRRWISIICLIIYIFIMPILGFYITSILFLILLSVYLRNENKGWKGYLKPVCLSIMVVGILYVTFDLLLKVPIPSGII
ncbi:tripartite tricarboxylate transporter TctB family protein [Pseudalkalibacillus sp. A8]|uniref:tripartite tricarboxylate transporter TctB family protein n=1 Tax=Pseudalkalibacillus sp. A8 TaxID=3382641 RepID=UPI0038B553AE